MTQQKNEYDNGAKRNVFLCNSEELGLIPITDKYLEKHIGQIQGTWYHVLHYSVKIPHWA